MQDDSVAASCGTCGADHPTYEHPWVFTFMPGSITTPRGELDLTDRYTVIRGTDASAIQQVWRQFHHLGAFSDAHRADRHESPEDAGVDRYGLEEVDLDEWRSPS